MSELSCVKLTGIFGEKVLYVSCWRQSVNLILRSTPNVTTACRQANSSLVVHAITTTTISTGLVFRPPMRKVHAGFGGNGATGRALVEDGAYAALA